MEKRSDMYLHDGQPVIKDTAKKPHPCKALGFCVCKEPGRSALFLQENFTALWKPFLKAPVQRRKKHSKDP